MPNAIDYSDSYLYWDQTESAEVTVRQFWNGPALVERSFSEVIVRRVSEDKESPIIADLKVSGKVATWLVPAVLVEGIELTDGDSIKVCGQEWIVNGGVDEVRSGPSLSHYRCICQLRRG